MFVALNTFPQPSGWERWRRAVDQAADLGVDAVIAADISVLDYAHRRHPDLPLHLSVQGSATNYEAIRGYHEHFGIRRVVLPRVLSYRKSAMCSKTARWISKCSASAGCASWSKAVVCCHPT